MRSLVSDHIASLVPYPPGKPIGEVRRELGIDDCIKLASNENPHGPSPLAKAAIEQAAAELHYYPDGGGFYLKRALSTRFDIPPEQIMLANGSNELLELLIRTFMPPGGDLNVVTSTCTFIVYKLASIACGVEFREAPIAKDMSYDLDAMSRLVDRKTRLVFIANPNNPTGTSVGADALAAFVSEVDSRCEADPPLIVLDEAYYEFVDAADYPDAFALLAQRPRTVILRTFSKAYGLAGIRCGYGFSSAEICNYVNRVRAPFNVNSLALAGAQAALDDDDYLKRVVALNKAEKERMVDALRQRKLGVVPSQTNFLLVDFHMDAKSVYEGLMRKGVILRPMSPYGLTTSLRITLGTSEENTRLLDSIDAFFRGIA